MHDVDSDNETDLFVASDASPGLTESPVTRRGQEKRENQTDW